MSDGSSPQLRPTPPLGPRTPPAPAQSNIDGPQRKRRDLLISSAKRRGVLARDELQAQRQSLDAGRREAAAGGVDDPPLQPQNYFWTGLSTQELNVHSQQEYSNLRALFGPRFAVPPSAWHEVGRMAALEEQLQGKPPPQAPLRRLEPWEAEIKRLDLSLIHI